ncbi:MAG TPA: alanine--glyoxylate aminotransferase family protein [Candidatus Binatia bacterium]|jgi:alanine-glyoxylate transaminase/serine-glyoxylate transaminase/serine-pyruvate transaminase
MATGDKPSIPEFHPPRRILLGPGPSPVDDRVMRAMAAPVVGHLDPLFLKCMDDIQVLLRYVFETQNRLTIPVSGTGSAGMEATVASLLEPGDEIVVCANGYFGERMCEMVTRLAAKCIRVEAEWGKPMDLDKVRAAWKGSKACAIFAVQAETSTGVLQPIAPLREMANERDGLLLIDAVTSLGAHEVAVDKNGIDGCYSGTQKGLSCPPGLAPVTFSERALTKIKERKTKPSSWYLDVGLVANYWGSERTYHHTAPISMNYALREALRIIVEEGLEARRRRHELNHRALVAGVEAMGLKMHVDPDDRLWTLNTVRVPDGVDDARVRKRLLDEFNIEIGGGLGVLKGRIWRIGLMGGGSAANNVLLLLAALEECLVAEGFKVRGSGVSAAESVYVKRE